MSEPYRGHCDDRPPYGVVHILEAGELFILLNGKDNRCKHKSRNKEEKEEKSKLHVNCLKYMVFIKRNDKIDMSYGLHNKVYLKTRSRLMKLVCLHNNVEGVQGALHLLIDLLLLLPQRSTQVCHLVISIRKQRYYQPHNINHHHHFQTKYEKYYH